MAKKFDPATLFEPMKRLDKVLVPYPNEIATLDAIKAGRKPIGLFSGTVAATAADVREQLWWFREVFARGLVITFGNEAPIPNWPLERQPIQLYVSQPDQLWRVAALRALDRTAFVDGSWSDASENLHSDLLGYTPAQRKQWIQYGRDRRPAWTCATVYAVLDVVQRESVESVGRRCFGTLDVLSGIKLMQPRRANEVRSDAIRRIPRGLTLARVGLRWKEFNLLFGSFESIRKSKKQMLEAVVPKKLAAKVSAGFVSNVQFLTKRGWS